ncbi:MAG: ankyrin repeat domain-containing protein [Rickettsiales bacterium]|nr:ankyrin repeat domain-containing protein [Rickettsiales bacterium]
MTNYYPGGMDLPIFLQEDVAVIKDFDAPKTAEIIRDILHNNEFSQSEKNIAFTYLWIRAVKEINDFKTAHVLSTKVKEEDLLQSLDENITDEKIKSFFEQQEQQSTTLEQIASFDGSTLSQDKLVLIKDKLIFDKVLGKQDLLVYAAKDGYLKVVEKLLDVEEIDVNKVGKDDFTALMLAAYNGYLEVVDKIFKKLCIDGVNHEDIHYIEGDRPKVFKDADKISSFANQIFSFIKSEFNLSEDCNHSLEILVRKSLFKEIFSDENKENVDFITNSFMQDKVADGISKIIVKNLRSSDEAIIPSSSMFCWIPFNNYNTLNKDHEGIEDLFTAPIKEFINQVLAPDPGSFIYN